MIQLVIPIDDLRFTVYVWWRFCAIRFWSRRLLRDLSRINPLARHTILSVSPAAKIDQLAAFGTKRPPRIVLPFNRLATRWTFRHKAKVERKDAKVKAGSSPTTLSFPELCRASWRRIGEEQTVYG